MMSFSSTYPKRAVTVIVPWGAGGGSDIVARMLADGLKKIFNVPFVVENKPGAAGEIGIVSVVNAKPDGYTIGVGINVPSSLTLLIQKPEGERTYKMEDLTRIANLDTDPSIIMVHSDSPFDSLDDFIEYAKENPNELSIAHTGPGGDDHLAQVKFEIVAGIKLKGVTYEGAAGQLGDLAGRHVDAAAVNVSQVKSLMDAGQIKPLAVMSEERVSLLPEVPTFKELGLDVINDLTRGVAGPAGLSEEIVTTLVNAIEKVLTEDQEFIKRAENMGLLIRFIGPEKYEEFLQKEYKDLKEIWEKDPWL